MILLLHRISVALAILLSSGVYAQPWTNATCTNPDTTWTVNSLGQSPCLVAAFLLAGCQPDNTWVIRAHSVNVTTGYVVSTSNTCKCNSIAWSLLAACSICQGLNPSSWLSYSAKCLDSDKSLAGVYPEPIPVGVTVPNWAYYNYLTTGIFNLDIARQQIGPESTAPPSASNTAIINTASSAATTSIPALFNNSSGISDTSAIVGGVVGGVLGISLFALIAFIIVHKSKQKKDHEPPALMTTQFDASYASYGQYRPGDRSSSLVPTTPSYKPYDPSTDSPSAFSVGHLNGPNVSDSVPNLYYQHSADTQPPPIIPQP